MQLNIDDFKNLLLAVKTENIGIKVRTHTGWSKNYLQIIGLVAASKDQANKTFNGVILSNLNETEGILINNVATIIAFELDRPCQYLKAQTVYSLADSFYLKSLASSIT